MARRLPVFAGAVLAAVVATRFVAAQADPLAARLLSGDVPNAPVQAVSAGEVLLSVNVSDAGAVGAIDVLRSTPPFTDIVVATVRGWRFAPAENGLRKPIASRVLVGATFGSPSLRVPTVGEPPKDLAPAATALPMPLTTSVPEYPPNARFGGSVMIETLIAPSGRVVGVTAIRSTSPFDEIAMDAARRWMFRPAQGPDQPPNPYAYRIFVFRAPVVGAAPRP